MAQNVFGDMANFRHRLSDAVTDFRIARAMRERENARLAQLERMKIEGELCLVEDVKREAYTHARRLRDTLLGALPTKLAAWMPPSPG